MRESARRLLGRVVEREVLEIDPKLFEARSSTCTFERGDPPGWALSR